MAHQSETTRLRLLAIAATGLALTATPASGQQSPTTSAGSNEPPILISDSNTGYVDNAIVGNQVRLRADASFNQKQPDRAEFFYAKCGCYRPHPSAPACPYRRNRWMQGT